MRPSTYALSIATVLLVACGRNDSNSVIIDSAPDVVTVGDLVGTWQAATDLFTNPANPAEQYDLVANGGQTRMTVQAGGHVRISVTLGDQHDEWEGQLSIDGTKLVATPTDSRRPTRVYVFELAGDDLTLQTGAGRFDFSRSGAAPVPASEYLEMTRE